MIIEFPSEPAQKIGQGVVVLIHERQPNPRGIEYIEDVYSPAEAVLVAQKAGDGFRSIPSGSQILRVNK